SDAYWFDPVFKGKYPDWVYRFEEINKPVITDEDLNLISQPLDFLGLNIYNGKYVSAQNGILPNPQGFSRTAIGWPVTPEALYWGPKFMFERYGKPIVITENGMACHDAVSLDGNVHDENRIDYFRRYLREYKRAADDGIELNGYYVWSLTDNFEWGHGYNQRFGITYIDYGTQKRIIKDSGMFIKDVIKCNGENL
ncbi:MAG: family 1 glycosylhydrolase, partial [Oscillospiraceae bacterium]|nr:family 1 glycosylhydrolase [Oscillospiraceae bacterium]